MEKKIGVCNNPDCDLCLNREHQEIEFGEEFVCRECGKPLKELEEKKKKKKKSGNKLPIIIITAILIIGGIIAAILALGGKSEPVTLTLNKQQVELFVGESDTIVALVEPEDLNLPVSWSSSDESVAMVGTSGIVRAIGEGQATLTALAQPKKGEPITALVAINVIVPAIEEEPVKDTLAEVPNEVDIVSEVAEEQPKPTVQQPKEKPNKPKASTLDLGYATYEPMEGASGIKDGKPHGNGIMRFKSRQTIPGTVDCVAEPGEWVNGMWRDGKVNAGTWYRNDGNQVIVKLGQRYNK